MTCQGRRKKGVLRMTAEQRKAMETVCDFIKKAGTYYIASAEGDQPSVRPYGVIHIFVDKLYIQTVRRKKCYKQFVDQKVELCCMHGGKWIRLSGTLVEDKRIEAEESVLNAYPSLSRMYKAGDGNNCVLYLTHARATISSFTEPEEVYEF